MITGLKYISDFISKEESTDLIKTIDSFEWSSDLKRRTQQYGYKYDYTKKKVDVSLYLGKIPDFISFISKRMMDISLFDKEPDQVIINEYLPGQGISRHVDCVPCFGATVASLSLSSTCAMEFEHLKSAKKGSMMLAPDSLLVLSDEARYDWMHSIPARKEDISKEIVYKRDRRISLTFRKVILS